MVGEGTYQMTFPEFDNGTVLIPPTSFRSIVMSLSLAMCRERCRVESGHRDLCGACSVMEPLARALQ